MPKKIVKRDKFFYAVPSIFPEWDYPTRNAIGMNLDDFYWKDQPVYTFEIKNEIYEISKEKAEELGRMHTFPGGKMPHIIPLDEFTKVGSTNKITQDEKENKENKETSKGTKENMLNLPGIL
jgi:hypothetical protein